MRILQDSLLSLIFFLFYNVKLLEICNSIRKKISNIEFVNNINMLAYRKFTENNYKQLKRIHERCLITIKKYRMLFILEKYVLMHFLKKKWFNMKTFIQLKKITKQFKKITQVLNIWFNSQFKWNYHLNKITNKMKNQVNILIKIISFTWNFLLF